MDGQDPGSSGRCLVMGGYSHLGHFEMEETSAEEQGT